MGKTLYLGEYCHDKSRRYSLPTVTLMEYVSDVISDVADDFSIISYALSNFKGRGRIETATTEKGKRVIYLPIKTQGGGKIKSFLTRLQNKEALLSGLLENVQNGDTLVVYHSLYLMDTIKRLRKKRSFRLILQVCEIYNDVTENKEGRKEEVSYILGADGYIFSSNTLNEMFNPENKPYAVIAGTYKREEEYEKPFDDGKIHLVYAGTFNPIKGGVFKAIDLALELDENYHLHILGNAEEGLFKAVIKRMMQAGAKTGCEITYDGCLQGEEYSKFLQKCHIGLSTQNENLPFSKTSFPSKILVYLANGLKVVSAPIEPVQATLSGGVYYYGDASFKEALSRAIADTADTRKIVNDLDMAARESICRLFAKNK